MKAQYFLDAEGNQVVMRAFCEAQSRYPYLYESFNFGGFVMTYSGALGWTFFAEDAAMSLPHIEVQRAHLEMCFTMELKHVDS